MVSEKQVDAFLFKMGEFAKDSITCFGPNADLLKEYFDRIRQESDIGACVLCFSLIDDIVFNCLKSYMPNLNKKIEDALFSPFGPLGTASARFSLAFSLGWMSQQSYECLNEIRRIRNGMVHYVERADFLAPAVSRIIDDLHAVPPHYIVGDEMAFLPEPIRKQRNTAFRALLEIALGRVDKLNPDADTRKQHEGGEALDQLVVAGGDAA